MEWIIVLIVVIVILFAFIRPSKAGSYRYRQRGPLFSKAEHLFLGVLEQSISDQYRVLGKVRVADILTPSKGMDKKSWQIAFNKISSKHFDYVLCDKNSLAIIAVIELDDKSHSSKKVKARDELLENACESANLKLIRFPAKSTYQIHVIREKITQAISIDAGEVTLKKSSKKGAQIARASS